MCWVAGSDDADVAKYDARILYATPTPGLAEVEPSMNWNPSVVAGIGVVADPAVLYQDMHSYLAASGLLLCQDHVLCHVTCQRHSLCRSCQAWPAHLPEVIKASAVLLADQMRHAKPHQPQMVGDSWLLLLITCLGLVSMLSMHSID